MSDTCTHPSGLMIDPADYTAGTRCDECSEVLPLTFQDPRRVDIVEYRSADGSTEVIESNVSFWYGQRAIRGTATMRTSRHLVFRNECASTDRFSCFGPGSILEVNPRGDVRAVCSNHSGVSRGWQVVR